jgi:hypothetical protein
MTRHTGPWTYSLLVSFGAALLSPQESSTGYKLQSEPVKEDALIPSGDSYFQRLFGFQLRKYMRWGQPVR